MKYVRRLSAPLATTLLALTAAALAPSALATEKPVKKTMDGRCLTADHPDYWKTKIYVAKPTMAACVKSGGKPA